MKNGPIVEQLPIHVSKPFKGFSTLVLVSMEGGRISYNSLPDEYMPEVEKLINKLNRKFGKRILKFIKKNPKAVTSTEVHIANLLAGNPTGGGI